MANVFSKGDVLTARYELAAVAGSGGMGQVWKAEDALLQRTVAIKFGPEVETSKLSAQNSILAAEARNGARLIGHPHIVATLDLGGHEAGDHTTEFIVFEYVEGVSAVPLVENLGKVADVETQNLIALHLTHEIVDAVQYSHERGILHRDLKPANVFVRASDGVLKVGDFGISRVISDPQRSETMRHFASVHFAAPEQYDLGTTFTSATDVYQLAATAFNIMTRRFLFEGTFAQIRNSHENEVPPRVSEANPAWSFAEVERLMESMLLKRANQRPELWELNELLCHELYRPWRLRIRDVSESRQAAVAKILELPVEETHAGVDTVYLDPRLAFRHAVRLLLQGVFNLKLEAAV